MTNPEKCPHCDGRGGRHAFINRGPDIRTHSFERVKCLTCKGDGTITPDEVRRIAEGDALRRERVDRGLSLHQAAKEQGISPAELSAREQGR